MNLIKLLNIVTYQKLESVLNELLAEQETIRNSIRKRVTEELSLLDATKDGLKIQKELLEMNKDLSMSYEKESFIRKYIDKLKS
jgi:hypothetical protein